jgi:hypothetical protein
MTVKVFQVKCALGKLGKFFEADTAVHNSVGDALGRGDIVYEAWVSAAADTRYGDKLSQAIEGHLGESATRAAYEAAASFTLEEVDESH